MSSPRTPRVAGALVVTWALLAATSAVAASPEPVSLAADADEGTSWIAQASPNASPAAAVLPRKAPRKIDPWEATNRRIFAINEAVDAAVLKPVATTYVKVVPEVARRTIGNVLGNFGDAWSTVNHFLQGKVQTGLEMTMRFAINTVLGMGGILDIASEAGLERKDEDFGQTLGRWGVPAGPYLVLPLLGPSSLREAAAMPLDRSANLSSFVGDAPLALGISAVGIVDARARLLNASRLLDDVALDKYVFMRDAYLSRRRSLVYDGDPPEESNDEAVSSDAAPAPAPMVASRNSPPAAESEAMVTRVALAQGDAGRAPALAPTSMAVASPKSLRLNAVEALDQVGGP